MFTRAIEIKTATELSSGRKIFIFIGSRMGTNTVISTGIIQIFLKFPPTLEICVAGNRFHEVDGVLKFGASPELRIVSRTILESDFAKAAE